MDSGLRTQDSGTIVAYIDARLGNQLFRYAFARALQVKFYPDYDLVLDVSSFKNATPSQIRNGFENSLKYFRIKYSSYSYTTMKHKRLFMRVRRQIRRLPEKILNFVDGYMLRPLLHRMGYYVPMGVSGYIKPLKSSSRKIFCNADFENPTYFNDIRDLLLEELTPTAEPLPENAALLGRIQSSESVCVHIRRGDFLSPGNASFFHVCDENYFITAMKAIREEIPDCKFFVFSDDVEEVKKNFHLPFDAEYAASSIPPYETLRLMYSCKLFIISNSTFSWWAQYLSRNPNKIVYAPTPWLWSGKYGEQWSGLYLPYMRTIACHKH